MTPTELHDLVCRRIDATNGRDWDTWQALHRDDAVRTAPELETPLVGSSAMRLAIETLVAAFPDYRLRLIDVIAQDERAAARIVASGTMIGELPMADGVVLPATGRAIRQEWVLVLHAEAGLITRADEYYDQLALIEQLGLEGDDPAAPRKAPGRGADIRGDAPAPQPAGGPRPDGPRPDRRRR